MNSLRIIKNSNKKPADHLIIFVHGFTGGSKTFVYNKTHFCNFFDISILDTCDICEFSYYSSIIDLSFVKNILCRIGIGNKLFGTKYNVNLHKYSQLLETHYSNYHTKYKSINIISHSMGGLIAKHFIIETIKKRDRFNGFYISLSTPHRGVSEAKLLSLLNNVFIDDMEPFSEFIDETTKNWSRISSQLKRKYYVATHDTIVNDRSACPAEDTKYLVRVEGNHTTIVKPSSADCTLMKNINHTIITFLGLFNRHHLPEQRKLSTDDILFYAFKAELESYYLCRDVDNDLHELIKCNNVWICGPSGTGKTNLIQHYLIANNCNFICFDMSPNPPNISSSEILSNIYWSLKTQFESTFDFNDNPDGSLPWINYISDLLCVITKDKPLFLFIDELHIDNDDVFDNFIDDVTTLTSFHQNRADTTDNIKLVISTIKDPLSCESIRYKSKFTALFTNYALKYWSNIEIMKLLELLNQSLRLSFLDASKTQIVLSANGSPRRLKVIIKKAINLKSFAKAIDEVAREGVY